MNPIEASSPIDLVRTRLANRDSAAMVADRLTEDSLTRLGQWYQSSSGGDLGRMLVHRRPLVAVGVDRHMNLSGSRCSRESAFACFSLGLAFGLLCRHALEVDGDPVGLSGCVAEDTLAELFLMWISAGELSQSALVAGATMTLVRLEPRVEWALLASMRLGLASARGDRLIGRSDHVSQLLFFAGLVGSGITIPCVNASEGLRSSPSTRSSD